MRSDTTILPFFFNGWYRPFLGMTRAKSESIGFHLLARGRFATWSETGSPRFQNVPLTPKDTDHAWKSAPDASSNLADAG